MVSRKLALPRYPPHNPQPLLPSLPPPGSWLSALISTALCSRHPLFGCHCRWGDAKITDLFGVTDENTGLHPPAPCLDPAPRRLQQTGERHHPDRRHRRVVRRHPGGGRIVQKRRRTGREPNQHGRRDRGGRPEKKGRADRARQRRQSRPGGHGGAKTHFGRRGAGDHRTQRQPLRHPGHRDRRKQPGGDESRRGPPARWPPWTPAAARPRNTSSAPVLSIPSRGAWWPVSPRRT